LVGVVGTVVVVCVVGADGAEDEPPPHAEARDTRPSRAAGRIIFNSTGFLKKGRN
jgi:hypothetical protein